jgi:hypothetical protein
VGAPPEERDHDRRPGQQGLGRHLPRRRSLRHPDRRQQQRRPAPWARPSIRRSPPSVSKGTRLKSLETSVYLKGNFIYGLFFSGPGQMVQPIDDPAAVFTRVFSDGVPHRRQHARSQPR